MGQIIDFQKSLGIGRSQIFQVGNIINIQPQIILFNHVPSTYFLVLSFSVISKCPQPPLAPPIAQKKKFNLAPPLFLVCLFNAHAISHHSFTIFRQHSYLFITPYHLSSSSMSSRCVFAIDLSIIGPSPNQKPPTNPNIYQGHQLDLGTSFRNLNLPTLLLNSLNALIKAQETLKFLLNLFGMKITFSTKCLILCASIQNFMTKNSTFLTWDVT